MTEAYRAEKLEEAVRNSGAARERWNSLPNGPARREAAEDLEFWSNKAAFLSAPADEVAR